MRCGDSCFIVMPPSLICKNHVDEFIGKSASAPQPKQTYYILFISVFSAARYPIGESLDISGVAAYVLIPTL
jgi:hypothetical protein